MKLTTAFFLPALLLFTFSLSAQPYVVKGVVMTEANNEGISGLSVQLEGTDYSDVTDETGAFRISRITTGGEMNLLITQGSVELYRQVIQVGPSRLLNLGKIRITPSEEGQKAIDEAIPVISLSSDDFDNEIDDQAFSGLLTASRDAFTATSGFTFGFRRFRIRGYGSEDTQYYINGMPINELDNGRISFFNFGGLNDVTRWADAQIGLQATDHTFGGMGGTINLNMRPSNVRKTKRISFSETNGGYRHRVMGTYSTGVLKNGWSIALSGSRRWAEEGYIDGTFYDAWSYYVGIEKRLNRQHSLALVAFGAPNRRGRSASAIQELYDLTGDNYYNPNWGYQNGEKRNARVGDSHQPNILLTHDWTANDRLNLTTTLHYQFGYNGSTAMDWYDFDDPRPDEYNRLPSYIEANSTPEIAELARQKLIENPALLQIDWASFYRANRSNLQTFENVDGIPGNTVTGNRSQVIIEDRRFDTEKLGLNTTLQFSVNDNFNLQAGLNLQSYKTHVFKTVEDLLGGDFYVDVDKFAEGENVTTGNRLEFDSLGTPDLLNPNRLAREGDVFGWNYDINVRNGGFWAQGQYNIDNFELFAAANVSQTQFWRTGYFQNGRFPNNSLGDSEKQKFTNYGIKAGLTYALDGRNYLFVNGTHRTRAPFVRNAYVAARTRDQLVPGLENVTIQGFDAGYYLRSPLYKIRAVAYLTDFKNEAITYSFYHEDLDVVVEGVSEDKFVNYAITNQDRRHMGLELALDVQLMTGLNMKVVAGMGQHTFSNRPNATIINDDDGSILLQDQTLFIENYRIAGQPQSAYNIGFAYRPKGFWSFWLDVSYFHRMFIGINETRRTEAAISYDPRYVDKVDNESTLWREIIDQEQPGGALMLDISARKSFRFGDTFLAINASVNNILDTQDFITGGFEQRRFDFEEKDVNRFPSRYFYGFGRGYFLNLSFRF
ncbi:MAG: TonB-dependent receptor plug domain-containing protein [Bacteroidota bacterium]